MTDKQIYLILNILDIICVRSLISNSLLLETGTNVLLHFACHTHPVRH